MSQPPKTRSSRLARGTTSVIFGERPSVRFPRRTVPICVKEPIGLAKPFRIARTPAIVVVLTAPSPTSRTPNFPFAGAIATGVDTGGKLYQLPASENQSLHARSCKIPRYATQSFSKTRRPSLAGRGDDRREIGRSLRASRLRTRRTARRGRSTGGTVGTLSGYCAG